MSTETTNPAVGLDLRPDPGSAPVLRRWLRQGLLETTLMLRNGEQLLLALVIPLAVLIAGRLYGARFGLDPDALVGSVLALALWSTAFTSVAISTGFDVRQGVFDRFAATPLGSAGVVIGKILAVLAVTTLQWLVLLAVALGLGWRGPISGAQTLVLVGGVALATCAFTAFAFILGRSLRAEITLALANVIYLAGLVLGGIVFGSEDATLRGSALPTGALGAILRAWATGRVHWLPLIPLAPWALVLLLIATRWRQMTTSMRALRGWSIAALVANIGIIVTGAVVRLTGSGLGCPTWPYCSAGNYVPKSVTSYHPIIEFGNRTLTFVLIAIALMLFITVVRTHAGRGPFWCALLAGLGIPFQGVIGGITVLTKLNPYVVALHLVLSLVLVMASAWLVMSLYGRTGNPVNALTNALAKLTALMVFVACWIGTIVTGSGPHAGDENAVRTGLDITMVARLHSLSVWATVILTITTLVLLTRARSRAAAQAWLLLGVLVLQGAIGYWQYFAGVPMGLVTLHMLGAGCAVAAGAALASSVRHGRPEQGAGHRLGEAAEKLLPVDLPAAAGAEPTSEDTRTHVASDGPAG